ncbi:helix-turn-helix protein [Kitasatospora atroaurantiaca]|uniref:Helix-turn-helix protein n=1 Tax=Kitasatospora atroaurantiaca TaxID=285545 RepID=A0A561EID7_9ACTN|nr:helix-turn-helix protein [Kitasatospora atroaurantiaca]
MAVLDQPEFGRRLRQLRLQRGKSQADLTGPGMSSAYLSRLESGARPPTDRAVSYLASRLGMPVTAFDEPAELDLAEVLATVFTLSDSDGNADARDTLASALATATDPEPLTRWLALSELARLHNSLADYQREHEILLELSALANELNRPALQIHARLRLARCCRHLGNAADTRQAAREALELGNRHSIRVSTPDLIRGKLLLISAEAELGDIAEAARLSDEVCELLDGIQGPVAAEAYWTAATVATRQGKFTQAKSLLGQAMRVLDSREDMTLWMRLRLAGASLSLQALPPRAEDAQFLLEALAPALNLVGTSRHRAEFIFLQAQLAFHQDRIEDAGELCRQTAESMELLSFRDQVLLKVLESRVAARSGDGSAVQRLSALAAEVQANGMPELAAEVWRAIAESVTHPDSTPQG